MQTVYGTLQAYINPSGKRPVNERDILSVIGSLSSPEFLFVCGIVMDEGERGGSAAIPGMNEVRGEHPQCTVRFQCGLLREMESFQGESVQHLSAETLLFYVCDMLQFKVCVCVCMFV